MVPSFSHDMAWERLDAYDSTNNGMVKYDILNTYFYGITTDKREPLWCLRFRSDPERTCKWMRVWRWNSLHVIKSLSINICLFGGGEFILYLTPWYVVIVIDRMALNCQCGTPRCNWSRLLLKSRALWDDQSIAYYGVALCISWLRESQTPVWVKNGIWTVGSAHVSF